MIFNPHDGVVPFALPESPSGSWVLELTTDDPAIEAQTVDQAEPFDMQARSLAVFRPA